MDHNLSHLRRRNFEEKLTINKKYVALWRELLKYHSCQWFKVLLWIYQVKNKHFAIIRLWVRPLVDNWWQYDDIWKAASQMSPAEDGRHTGAHSLPDSASDHMAIHRMADRAPRDKIIKLNVGGVFYTTAKSTLTAIYGSRLWRIATGDVHVMRDERGSIFLDRDGYVFRYDVYLILFG